MKHLKEYWFIYAFCVQLILTWGFITNSIQNHETRLEKLEAAELQKQILLVDIQTRLSSIETSIKYIERNI